jgi:predicted DNA binding CopG/RHH family protein
MRISKRQSKYDDPLDRDLSDLIKTGKWKAVRFELEAKNRTITIRLSERLLRALKKRAHAVGLDYQKFIRLALERFVEA